MNFYKIASVDLVNIPLLEKVPKHKNQSFYQLECQTYQMLRTVEIFKKNGNKNLILLHCLSSYPANENEINLRAIDTLKNSFNIPVGLSDHCPSIEVSLMSIGLGANIIERHFTLDRKLEGPGLFIKWTQWNEKTSRNFKNSEEYTWRWDQENTTDEYVVINSPKKKYLCKKILKKEKKFPKNNIVIKGPGGGILPKYLDLILNRRAKFNIDKDYPVTWEMI